MQTKTAAGFYPEAIISWAAFKAGYPDGTVLSRQTGYSQAYGNNPYLGYDNGISRDRETGSSWNALGRAVFGPLQGTRLHELPAINHFWFSWAAFRPETRIYQPAGL